MSGLSHVISGQASASLRAPQVLHDAARLCAELDGIVKSPSAGPLSARFVHKTPVVTASVNSMFALTPSPPSLPSAGGFQARRVSCADATARPAGRPLVLAQKWSEPAPPPPVPTTSSSPQVRQDQRPATARYRRASEPLMPTSWDNNPERRRASMSEGQETEKKEADASQARRPSLSSARLTISTSSRASGLDDALSLDERQKRMDLNFVKHAQTMKFDGKMRRASMQHSQPITLGHAKMRRASLLDIDSGLLELRSDQRTSEQCQDMYNCLVGQSGTTKPTECGERMQKIVSAKKEAEKKEADALQARRTLSLFGRHVQTFNGFDAKNANAPADASETPPPATSARRGSLWRRQSVSGILSEARAMDKQIQEQKTDNCAGAGYGWETCAADPKNLEMMSKVKDRFQEVFSCVYNAFVFLDLHDRGFLEIEVFHIQMRRICPEFSIDKITRHILQSTGMENKKVSTEIPLELFLRHLSWHSVPELRLAQREAVNEARKQKEKVLKEFDDWRVRIGSQRAEQGLTAIVEAQASRGRQKCRLREMAASVAALRIGRIKVTRSRSRSTSPKSGAGLRCSPSVDDIGSSPLSAVGSPFTRTASSDENALDNLEKLDELAMYDKQYRIRRKEILEELKREAQFCPSQDDWSTIDYFNLPDDNKSWKQDDSRCDNKSWSPPNLSLTKKAPSPMPEDPDNTPGWKQVRTVYGTKKWFNFQKFVNPENEKYQATNKIA